MSLNVDELSWPALCSVLTWGSTATNDGAERQPATDRRRRSLVTSDDLRNEIASLVAQRDAPRAATAATTPSFVTTTGMEQQKQQQQKQVRHQTQRNPLIVLYGPHEPFLSALLDSPLGIDPVFIEAHVKGRRYRPRGARRRRGGGATAPAHWDYPELVTGYGQATKQQGNFPIEEGSGTAPGRRPAVRPVSDVNGDLAAVFCRASLWGAEGVDVLFLDYPLWRLPGSTLRIWARGGRSDVTVERGGVKRLFDDGRWQVFPSEKGEAATTLEDVLQEAMGADDVDGALEEVLEETAYDHWSEFFEILTPRRKDIISDRISLEWQVMEALERNTDMRDDIARRRRSPSIGSSPGWEGLTRRLRLRVEMLSTMAPLPKVPPAQSSKRRIHMHENNLASFPIARQPVPADGGSDPSSGANENQRALDRVTYLGGVLLPFSIVSGVLSMNDDFGPGHALFWVFWVAAVPLAVVAILVIYADKLRRAEVWVAVPVEGEDYDEGGDPVPEEKEHETKKKGRKRQEPGPEPAPRVSMPGASVQYSQPEAVTYSATGEVVIDLGTPTATIEHLAISAEPPPPPSPVSSPMPDDDQDQPGQQAGEEVDLQIPEVVESDGDTCFSQHSVHPPPPPGGMQPAPLRIPPNTNPIPTAGTDPGIIFVDAIHHRRRELRRQQLGWVGAVLCMLNLRKPSLVSEGAPVGATRGTRRRSRRKDAIPD